MTTHLSLILTAPPAQTQAARAYGLPVAHMAYRVGAGPHLLRSSIPISLRGGLLMLDDRGWKPACGDLSSFCQELKRECLARGYDGIVANWEGAPGPESVRLTLAISELAANQSWPCYVPERFGGHVPRSRVMISSALSGGSLKGRLKEALDRFGPNRTTLAVERCCADFTLPSSNGQGRDLSVQELARLTAAHHPAIYFSDDLCARYFTYRTQQRETHFVLFDDAATIRKKLHIAREMGIKSALMAYPEVSDLLPGILKKA